MSRQNISRADETYIGRAVFNRAFSAKPGVLWTPTYIKKFGAIAAAAANAICLSQSITAGTPALINGALAGGSPAVATIPTPRALVAAWTTASVLTITGTDEYGTPLVESSASGTAHTGKKAFKTVTAVNVSISVTLATVGTSDVIGMPHRVDNGDTWLVLLNGRAIDAATFVVADTTTPATALTGDTRGTFDPSAAINGANIFTVIAQVNDRQTKDGAYGVTQFGG